MFVWIQLVFINDLELISHIYDAHALMLLNEQAQCGNAGFMSCKQVKYTIAISGAIQHFVGSGTETGYPVHHYLTYSHVWWRDLCISEWGMFWCGEEHFYICTKNTLLQKCNTLSPWICSEWWCVNKKRTEHGNTTADKMCLVPRVHELERQAIEWQKQLKQLNQ